MGPDPQPEHRGRPVRRVALADPDRGRRRRRHPARRAVDRRRRHLLGRGTPGRGRPADVLVRAAADGSTSELTPAPFNVRSRVHEYGGGSYVVVGGIVVFSTSPMGGSTGSIRAPRRPCRSPRTARGATPTCGPTSPGAVSTPSARTTAARARRPTRSSPSRSTAATRRCSSRAPTSSPRRASRPTARGSPGSNGITRTCPGTRRCCGSRRSSPTGRSARPSWPPAAPTSRSSSPNGRPTARSTSSATGRAGGTCTAWSTGRGWSRSPRWRPSSPTRPGRFDRSSYGFLPDGAVVAVARSGGRDHLYRIEPGARVAELEMPFTELEWLRVGAHAVVALAGRAGRPVRHRALRSGHPGTGRRPAPGERRSPSTRRSSPSPSRSSSRRRGDRTAHALYYPPTNPDFRGPDGEKPPLIVLSHGGPTSNASTVARPREAVPDQPRASRSSTSTTAGAPATGASTAGASTDSGASSTSTIASPLRSTSSSAAMSTRTGWPSRAAAPAATRRSRPLPSVTSSRPGSASTGSATWSCSRRIATSSSRSTTGACSAPIPRPPPSTANARRAISPTDSRARS